MPDYKPLIDDEMWAYIHKLDSLYPPDAVDLDIAGQRAVYDRMCAAFRAVRPKGVVTWDEPYGGVACRRYEVGASEVTVVYFHGGGSVVGSLESHDDICAEICARTGYRVIAVDYGLAPEALFPQCFNDCWAAFDAIRSIWGGRILLAGDSAGGNRAAAVAHYARGQSGENAVGQVLIYPGLGGERGSHPSQFEHAEAPHLTARDLEFYRTVRTGGEEPPADDPRIFPLADRDFSNLPPTVIVTVECDPLSGDGELYCTAIRAAGGQAIWFEEPGLVHACLRARNMSRQAALFFDRVVDAVEALGKGTWPYAEPAAAVPAGTGT
jgi:acetyl esterase